jgi:2-isopropylmalate synthase
LPRRPNASGPSATAKLVVAKATKRTSSAYNLTSILREISELGLYTRSPSQVANATLDRMKELETVGYKFDDSLASVHLLILEQMGSDICPFRVTQWETSTVGSEAGFAKVKATLNGTVGLGAKERKFTCSSAGVGPIHAIDLALRSALREEFPETKDVKLVSYALNIVDSSSGSAASVRARTEFHDSDQASSSNHHPNWATVSVSEDLIDASIRSLIDGYRYKLIFLNKKERFAVPDWRAAIS